MSESKEVQPKLDRLRRTNSAREDSGLGTWPLFPVLTNKMGRFVLKTARLFPKLSGNSREFPESVPINLAFSIQNR